METASLLARSFVSLSPEVSGPIVRVMQMNVLADRLAPPSAFPHTEPAVLPWAHRKGLLLQQITALDPDVVCLEEVDHFDDHFLPALSAIGYAGFFKRKNGEGDVDGCALFYKTARFELVAHRGVDYEGHTQVALLARLRLRPSSSTSSSETSTTTARDVCVAVTHLKAKEGFEAKRLDEGVLLLASARAFIDDTNNATSTATVVTDPPLVVLGDFNDVPSSLVCRYFRGEPLPSSTSSSSSSSSLPLHAFKLASAYACHPPLDQEGDTAEGEPYSTYKKRETEVKRTIDYVWYAVDALKPVGLLAVPPSRDLPDRLPCANHPSDHLALC